MGWRRTLTALLGTLAMGAVLVIPASAADQDAALCPAPKKSLRGLWLASVGNINWPSAPGQPAEQVRAEYRGLLDGARRIRANAVFVQVRPTADALYPSEFEPWSHWLTGEQGKDPGWDPLAFAVREAHARNLEFHAWFNPYRVSKQGDITKLAPNHPARLHPEWVLKYGDGLYYNPGVPEVRAFVEKVIVDVVRRYDIDGVHFDDYFYPYPVAGQQLDDERAYKEHGAGFPNRADWRRDNVDRLVSGLAAKIKAAKPWVTFGVSPFAVWRNGKTDSSGSDTAAGIETYDDLYADTRKWIRQRWIDYVAPQTYWHIGFPAADYVKLVDWWSREVRGTGVALYLGQAAYRIGSATSPQWTDPEEMPRQLRLSSAVPEVGGHIYFQVHSVLANPLGFRDRLSDDIYRTPSLVPPRSAVPGWGRPWAPTAFVARADGGHQVRIRPTGLPSAYYAVYRTERRGCATMLDTVRADANGGAVFVDRSARPGVTYTYLVTAVDRGHHEGPAGKTRPITA
ncbi:family 10 glycosylhydrolase [Allokutzneria sp. A3M-2-11 16]|uniref:glycoside hydrolase family 10 protein n=1 Tax=Allokutzneria sp. A3M-2-11 16 TaxID=2962043 RepID=UPI0020B7BCDC|nr:family 10 glycosylhydrolase [Allokutzneria sp. A3M-2-11 16]MCP3804232.1 family 10 glycosylhydrolase [Allokutzneria sp. A3M-2-11 16]